MELSLTSNSLQVCLVFTQLDQHQKLLLRLCEIALVHINNFVNAINFIVAHSHQRCLHHSGVQQDDSSLEYHSASLRLTKPKKSMTDASTLLLSVLLKVSPSYYRVLHLKKSLTFYFFKWNTLYSKRFVNTLEPFGVFHFVKTSHKYYLSRPNSFWIVLSLCEN